MLYTLRYYCYDADAYLTMYGKEGINKLANYNETLQLLNQIQSGHHVMHEQFKIRSTEQGSGTEQESIYREHMVSRVHILLPRLEELNLRHVFRSHRGYYHIGDIVAILEDGEVGWCTGSNNSFRRFVPSPLPSSFRPDHLYFLEALLEKGPALLEELCFPVRGLPEQRLLEKFKLSEILVGIFRANVLLRERKKIDLLCETAREVWVIEGKTTLTWEAYGQARGYAKLFQDAYKEKPVRPSIVCIKSDAVIEKLCQNDGIVVFVENSQGFEWRGFESDTTDE